MAVSSLRVAASNPRARRCSVVLVGLLLSGCASGTGPDAKNEARRALAAAQEPVLMTLVGNPFEMDQARLNALISNELARGVTGMSTEFTTAAERAAAPEPHLVVVLNPVNEPAPEALCVAPETVLTAPADEQVQILAAFCRGDHVLNAARTEAVVGGPTDQGFRRLLWRTSSALFPDDYAESYGFGILPRWVDFGLGGSFGR
jgi:hypothetical protein